MNFKKLASYFTLAIIIFTTGYFLFKSLDGRELKTINIQGSCSSGGKVGNLTLLEIQKNLNKYIPISSQIPKEMDGALSENIPNYISVRFQNAIYYLVASAVENEEVAALDKFFKVAEYSFSFQEEDGGFNFIQPDNISKKPTKQDLLSGSIFFLSTFSISLVLLSQSEWFNTLPENRQYTERIESYKIKLSKALNKIISDKQDLIDYDKIYSNRLFFDALAFIASSKIIITDSLNYFNIGKEFLEMGLKNQEKDGYFLEKDGFDSSYQGVSLNLLYFIYSLNSTDSLCQNIQLGQKWLATRINETGEVILEGNSRVGGNANESFLGETKTVAAKDVGSSFFTYGLLTGDENSINIANLIKNFYK